MKKMRKGFTLVELLIVVAILGTLSAAMMMATNDATPKAQANQIVADMKTIATIVPQYILDTSATGGTATDLNTNLAKYVFGTDVTKYEVADGGEGNTDKWYVTYTGTLTTSVITALNEFFTAGVLEATVTSSAGPKMRIK